MKASDQDVAAKKVWDYLLLHQRIERADCILVLGSNDMRVAEWSAKLFLDGWAPLLIFSGTGFGHKEKNDLLATDWNEPEAEIFAKIVVQMGVPREKILIEDKSTNTGENILFTRELLKEKNIHPQKFILVQKPYMERRAYATFKKLWPGKEVIVTSPRISYEDYPTDAIPKEMLINIMVGDLQRITLYAKKGFQIPQEIPKDVWEAYEKLVEWGYTKHLT